METIHLLQAIVYLTASMLVVASQFKTRYSDHLYCGGTILTIAVLLSLFFAIPSLSSIQGQILLALKRLFPALSEKSADTIYNALAAQTFLAVLLMNVQGLNRSARIILTTIRISGEFALAIKILLLSTCLIGCQPKAKPATPAALPLPTVDSARIKLQNQADTSRSRADRAADASNSTVTDYETDAKTYDSLPNPLP